MSKHIYVHGEREQVQTVNSDAFFYYWKRNPLRKYKEMAESKDLGISKQTRQEAEE